jgi:hypothetical protein
MKTGADRVFGVSLGSKTPITHFRPMSADPLAYATCTAWAEVAMGQELTRVNKSSLI